MVLRIWTGAGVGRGRVHGDGRILRFARIQVRIGWLLIGARGEATRGMLVHARVAAIAH